MTVDTKQLTFNINQSINLICLIRINIGNAVQLNTKQKHMKTASLQKNQISRKIHKKNLQTNIFAK